MSETIPQSHRDLLEGPVFNTFVTILPDGMPHASVVWSKLDGDHILVSTTVGRRKEQNIRQDPKVNILTIDPENPYRYLEVRGEVTDVIEKNAVDLIDELAELYVGKSPYYGAVMPAENRQQEQRVILKIKPTKVVTRG